jgi:hypothetical protein
MLLAIVIYSAVVFYAVISDLYNEEGIEIWKS